MAQDVAYMPSAKNLPDILAKIKTAGTPPKFTYEFLRKLGFRSSNDRAVVRVLRQLGLLDHHRVPTDRYHEFKDDRRSGQVLAEGLRKGWSEIFLTDEQAHTRTHKDVKGVFQRVTGKSESVAEKMATTFLALAKLADFSDDGRPSQEADAEGRDLEGAPREEGQRRQAGVAGGVVRLTTDVHVHLPQTTDASVYTAIFRALREELL